MRSRTVPTIRKALIVSAALTSLLAVTDAAAAKATTLATTPTQAATGATYVAMGDSYSAGEGVTPYEDGTDTTSDQCHRSPGAYGSLLAKTKGYSPDGYPKAGAFDFAACSGAVTHDLFQTNYKYSSEIPQLSHLGPATKVVTLTIGGNDLGLTNWIGACLDEAPMLFGHAGPDLGAPGNWGCKNNALLNKQGALAMAALGGANNGAILRTSDPSSADPTLGTPKTDQNGNTVPIYSILAVLQKIHSFAPSARIFLSRYPRVFGPSTAKYQANPYDHASGYECDVTPPTGLTYDYADAMAANAIDDQLATIEQTAVQQIAATGVKATFVDPTTQFTGHANCDALSIDASGNPVDGQKWINGISPTITGSFHPSADGQKLGYLPVFLAAFASAGV